MTSRADLHPETGDRKGYVMARRASGPARLLITDDEPTDRRVLRWLAEACGCTVREASGLDEMTAIMRDWQPDLMVLDLVMPEADGIETMRHLKRMQCPVPLLLITAFHGVRKPAYDLASAYGLNVIDVIGKPIDADSFTEKLRGVVATQA
jgi:CheY-like chemotaxis protein